MLRPRTIGFRIQDLGFVVLDFLGLKACEGGLRINGLGFGI